MSYPERPGLYGQDMGSNVNLSAFLDPGVQVGAEGREGFPPSQGLLESMSQSRGDFQGAEYGGYGGHLPPQASQGFTLQALLHANSLQQQVGKTDNFPGGVAEQGILAPQRNEAFPGLFPSSLMSTLNLLQKNITTLQALIPLLNQSGTSTAQQEAAKAGVANVLQASMAQLASAAAGLLPHPNDRIRQSLQGLGASPQQQRTNSGGGFDPHQQDADRGGSFGILQRDVSRAELALDREEEERGGASLLKEDDESEENLPEGSYDVMELDATEILAEHTHFCEICNKGFKRDANLRMHMRGHGDQYKTAAALAKPDKPQELPNLRPKRYSCPYAGCKRNRKHAKFQPLKTMLCVKNHYRRSHCPKVLSCSKCGARKFSVVADLKTHEKHCGREKWMCSCKTTFSRKDKLLGHLNLFKGHTPVLPNPTGREGDDIGGGGAMPSPHSQSNATSLAVAEALGLDLRKPIGDQPQMGGGSFNTPNLLSSFYDSSLGDVLPFALKEEGASEAFWEQQGPPDGKH